MALPPSWLKVIAVAAFAAITAGCASYAPLPLDQKPRLAASLAELDLGPGWARPAKPLDATDLAILAVRNNPDLRVARTNRGIAQAQVLEAGLLPNPQISAQYGVVTYGAASAPAWTVSLAQDVKSLVTLRARRQGARYAAQQVDADIVWAEWQVIGRAQLLFVQEVEQAKLRQLLVENRALFADRYERSRRAVEQGNLPLSTAAPDLVALSDIDRQIADFDRQAQTRRQEIDALLGLDPSVRLTFVPEISLPEPSASDIERAITQLPRTRPDLVALQFGYESQEQKVRAAILAQFPNLLLGGIGGQDTTPIGTAGPAITIDLPIFNRNQGAIAIERATRQQLHDEYTTRLSRAVAEIRALYAAQTLLRGQLAAAQASLAEAQEVAAEAERAYSAGNLDERSYVDMAVTVISKQEQILALEQAILEQQAALTALIGADLPMVPDIAATQAEG